MSDTSVSDSAVVNVALRLARFAQEAPEQVAVAAPLGKRRPGRPRRYARMTFRELEEDSNRIASGIQAMNIPPQTRIALMVRPGVEFVSLVFAMLKAELTMVLIDPGMGRKNLVECLQAVRPEGFIAIPLAHAVRCVMRRKFPLARYNVTVGRRWFWGGPTLSQVRANGRPEPLDLRTRADDPAAIIFTTGSTGPPKGVAYRHETFDRQVAEIQGRYGIEPGEIDLPGFPLFGLFNSAMGVTTVIPDMDPTRPADVDPENILEAAEDWNVTQSFGSPALWNTVGRFCERQQRTIPTLKRVLSAGAPVPPHVIRRVLGMIHPEGDISTPYGATEALPVATISGKEVLQETAARTERGEGVCVGSRFPGIEWRVIQIDDGALESVAQTREVSAGEIGELMVRGAVVTREYVTRTDANSLHKVSDGDAIWHRMGDVGYLEPADEDRPERFWFCGRKSHRVTTADGPMYTVPCEAIINTHPKIYRSALVGVGEPGGQTAVVIAEPWPEHWPDGDEATETLIAELRTLADSHQRTCSIQRIFLRQSLPVDIRHNAKIFREKLRPWAAEQLARD